MNLDPADRLQHHQQVASGDELHNQWAVPVLHDHTQQLHHSLVVETCHDVPLCQQWFFALPER